MCGRFTPYSNFFFRSTNQCRVTETSGWYFRYSSSTMIRFSGADSCSTHFAISASSSAVALAPASSGM